MILNTETGAHSTLSQDGLRKKMKPYKSTQTRRMPDNPGGPVGKSDGSAYNSLVVSKPRNVSQSSQQSDGHHGHKF